jgi:hypothetical protein
MEVKDSTVACVTLFVLGIIKAKCASPARIAEVLYELSLTDAKQSSMKRTIRRVDNDPQVNATVCLHRFARERLFVGYLKELILILDPTAQEGGVVMVEVALRYRKRTCQLPGLYCRAMFRLEKTVFGVRVESLLDMVQEIVPHVISVALFADRAFETPAFTDMPTRRSWHYVV